MFTIGIHFTHLLKQNTRRTLGNLSMKPPNILIFGNNAANVKLFKDNLGKVLAKDTYVVYDLNQEKFFSHPWQESCAVLCYEGSNQNASSEYKLLHRYLTEFNGKILFLATNKLNVQKFVETNNLKEEHSSDMTMMKYYKKNGCLSVISYEKPMITLKLRQLYLLLKEMDLKVIAPTESILDARTQTPGYFVTKENKQIGDIFNLDLLSRHVNILNKTDNERAEDSQHRFAVYQCIPHSFSSFNIDSYYSHLNTKLFGKHFIYTDLIHSTQNLFKKLNLQTFKSNGIFVTAKQQSHGVGRTGNQWLSPIGCMMFTLNISFPLKSYLGTSLPIIQHLAVVAFVKGVKSKPGYENLELNIKWPNDIYIKKNQKIGGVVVNSSCFNDIFFVNIGLGVNISNKHPTYCVNQLIKEYNEDNNENLADLTIEETIAYTMNEIESLVALVQVKGIAYFKKEYYKYWLHKDTEVTLEREGNKKARIIGISDNGYLQCRLEDNTLVLLQPDGNSFDMMSNMIFIKSY